MNLELEKRISTSLETAREMLIKDQDSLTVANGFLQGLKAIQKQVDTVFNPIIDAAHKAHKEALKQKKEIEEPLNKAESLIKSKIIVYMSEQRRIQQEQEEARRKAEEERKRLEEEALRKAQEAEQGGNDEEAEKILEAAANQENNLKPLPEIQAKVETSGLSMRENWTFEIIDENLIPRNFMIPDRVKIGKFVRVMKGKTEIPGVRAYNDPTLAARIN